MATGQVKKEEQASPAPMSSDDEDIYEDAGDLEFYDKAEPHVENMYSARLPDYLWKKWATLTERMSDNDEARLGMMRIWNEGGKTRLRLLLNDDIPEHQGAPKEYELEVADNNVNNLFIFSEKDLPRFAAREKARRRAAEMDLPMPQLNRAKDAGVEKKTGYGKGRYQNNFFQHIPKQTKLVGKIHYELRVEPKDKGEEDRMVMQQLRDMEHPHDKLKILSRNKASAISNVGTAPQQRMAGFIKDTGDKAKPKKGEKVKNARIAKNDLLDMLFRAFGEFQYWSMKALRQRTQQPDAYLREVLEDIAVLNKSGKFANTYSLMDAFKEKKHADAKLEAAEEDDDEDEEEEMEDVV